MLPLVKSRNIYENNTYIRFLCVERQNTRMESHQVINNQQRQQFQISVDGEIAFLEYRFHDKVLVLMHTEVPERSAGRGLGSALVAGAFDYAKTNQLRVKVYCPFVKKYLDRHPEYNSLVLPPS